MKILNLKVEGFRSLKSVDWSPGDLNIIIGPNASGKSNLLSLLEMLSLSAQGRLADFVKKQGGMEPLVWDGKAESIDICLKTSPVLAKELDTQENFIYKLTLARLGASSSHRIENEKLGTQKKSSKFINESIGRRDENETYLYNAGNIYPLTDKFRAMLEGWCIYNYLDTSRDSSIRQPVVTSYETHVDADGRNFIAVLHTFYEENRNFKQEINSAMLAAFGDDFEELSFPPAADGRTQLRIRWKSLNKPQSAANLSDGTLRFLYLLTILANPKPPSLIAIDEPETGLHPSMFPIIADFATEASQRSQIMITTHSPEFLSAFGKTQPTTTVAQWHDGQTELRVLCEEKLQSWLKEYSLGELYRSGELEDIK